MKFANLLFHLFSKCFLKSSHVPDAVFDAEDNAAMETDRQDHYAQGACILELK